MSQCMAGARLQLWQQARKEAAFGSIPHPLAWQHVLCERFAVRGRERVQRKVGVLRQLLADLLEGALLAEDAPAGDRPGVRTVTASQDCALCTAHVAQQVCSLDSRQQREDPARA